MLASRFDYKKIKKFCKYEMKKQNISQKTMADKLNVTQQAINYALSEPYRMQPIIYDMFLEMGFVVTLSKEAVQVWRNE